MSTLAAARMRATSALLSVRQIDEAARHDGDLRKAVDALDNGDYGRWRQVAPVGCEWDDLLNEVSGFGPPPVGSRFEAALLALAESSDECVVWYPGDAVATLPIVDDEREFASRVTELVARGNIEPQLRFIRRTHVDRR